MVSVSSSTKAPKTKLMSILANELDIGRMAPGLEHIGCLTKASSTMKRLLITEQIRNLREKTAEKNENFHQRA